MALKLKQKEEIVTSVVKLAKRSLCVIAAHNQGLAVMDMNALRQEARNNGVHIRVARNTLVRRAFKGTAFECMTESLVGPVVLIFAESELSAGARLIKEFSKKNEKLVVKAISLGGKLFGSEHLEAVAKLPTREEAIAKLMAIMQAPIAKFVRTVAAPQVKLVRTVAAIRDQKQTA